MKLCIAVICLIVSVTADVSHLKHSGYVYNVPSPVFELPSAPVKEYLPPTVAVPAAEEIVPDVIAPSPAYLPPVEVPAPIIPVVPTNEYLPPSEPSAEPEIVKEIISEPAVEPVKEYLPPSVAPPTEYLPPSAAPATEYLPPSVPPTEEYQAAAETDGYRYNVPLTKFLF